MPKGPTLEERIIAIFNEYPDREFKNNDLKNELNYQKDISGITKRLVYWGYLKNISTTKNGIFKKAEREYSKEDRKEDRKNKEKKSYEMVLNKVFTGSFLYHNLGHEIINFIKDDNGQRFVYLNPWGDRGSEAEQETKYAFHIIESSIKDETNTYEIIAVSEINQNVEHDIYSRGEDRQIEKANSPVYKGYSFYDIFYCGPKSDKAHVFTYKANSLLLPQKDKRIIVKVKQPAATIKEDRNVINITLMCNPQHNIAYADDIGKKVYNANKNTYTDVDVLKELVDQSKGYFRIAEPKDDVNIDKLDDEQCFAVISDRTNLEDSTSNQIAYFLSRDKHLLYHFLHDFLGIKNIKKTENFEISREYENIDLLFLSDSHAIVIENKIDSDIKRDSETKNPETEKYSSQLSKYYKFVQDATDKIFEDKSIPSENKKFFVLAPEYNPITQKILNDDYECGSKYKYVTYTDLLEHIKNKKYHPLGLEPSKLGKFLFSEFIKTIEYISWSKAMQRERTAYIRLAQRINELKNKHKLKKAKKKHKK